MTMTIKGRILAHLTQHGSATPQDLQSVIDADCRPQLHGLHKKGFVKQIGKRGRQVVWALGETPVSEYDPRPGTRAEPNSKRGQIRARAKAMTRVMASRARQDKRDQAQALIAGMDRDALSQHVEAFLASGGEIEDLGTYRQAGPRMVARGIGSELA